MPHNSTAPTHGFAPEQGRFEIALPGRYLVHQPAAVSSRTVLVVALHGYGSNPEAMLRLSTPLVGGEHIVAAIQAPNQHYLTLSPGSPEIGYNWGTRAHGDLNIRLHHDMVRRVLDDLRRRFAIPPRRCLLMGFSQPVGLNYRFLGTYPEEAGGVIGICGGVPKDWEEDKYHAIPAPVLHIARSEDEFYPPSVTQGYAARLRCHAADVEFHLLPGAHRFPSKAAAIVKPWMDRVFGTAAAPVISAEP